LRECVVANVQGKVVSRGLEHRQRPFDERTQLLGCALRHEVDVDDTLLDSPAQLTDAISGRRGSLGEGTRTPERLTALAGPEQGVDELELENEVGLGGRMEGDGPLEQAGGGAEVPPNHRTAAAGGQAAPRRRGQLVIGVQPKLGAVTAGLLQVVAEDLVQLHKVCAPVFEPRREAPVQVDAG
jgi:hypothetical protein